MAWTVLAHDVVVKVKLTGLMGMVERRSAGQLSPLLGFLLSEWSVERAVRVFD